MDEQELRRSLGRTVRALRYGAGYGSQEAFAQAARMHVTYVGSIERGERNLSLRNLVRIAEALGMTPSRLLAEAEEAMRRDGPLRREGP